MNRAHPAKSESALAGGRQRHRAHRRAVARRARALRPGRRFPVRSVRHRRRVLLPGRLSLRQLRRRAGRRSGGLPPTRCSRCRRCANGPQARVARDRASSRCSTARWRRRSSNDAAERRMSDLLAAWRDRVRAATAATTPLRIVGGGSKDFYGQQLAGEIFDTSAHAGIVDYDPTELVITARCGTPLPRSSRRWRDRARCSPSSRRISARRRRSAAAIAAGLSGPRRPYAGAVRDLVLGVRLLDGTRRRARFRRTGDEKRRRIRCFAADCRIAGDAGRHPRGVAQVPAAAAGRDDDARFELPADEALRRLNEWSAAAAAPVGELLAPGAAACAPVRRRQRRGGRGAALGRRAARRRRELLGRGARPDTCHFFAPSRGRSYGARRRRAASARCRSVACARLHRMGSAARR